MPRKTLKRQRKQRGGVKFPWVKQDKADTELHLTHPVRGTNIEYVISNKKIDIPNDKINLSNNNIQTQNDNIQNALKTPGCVEVGCRLVLGVLECVCKAPVLAGQAIAALASGGTRKKQIRDKPRKRKSKNKTGKKQYK